MIELFEPEQTEETETSHHLCYLGCLLFNQSLEDDDKDEQPVLSWLAAQKPKNVFMFGRENLQIKSEETSAFALFGASHLNRSKQSQQTGVTSVIWVASCSMNSWLAGENEKMFSCMEERIF